MLAFEVICKEKENNSMSFTKQFDLTVIDVNEAPSPGCKYPLYVLNEVSLGTAIGSVNVTDPDNMNTKDVCNPKQRLKYAIISEENLPFKILDGYLVKTDHVEMNKTYIIEISVKDDGSIVTRNFTRIHGKPKTTLFNCTVISLPMIGSQITLSSNQIEAGSPNASIIGYMNAREDTEYKLMKDTCNSYPFVMEGNKLMLMLSTYTGPRSDDEFTVPQYAMVRVRAKDTSNGHLTHTRFAIFIKDDVKTRSLICFSNDRVQLSQMAKTKLGPIIIIYQTQDNNTELTCPSASRPTNPPHYRCNVKPNLTESSQGFSRVNFTNTLYVDTEMFLRVNVSFTEDISSLDKLVLDLFCWEPDHLFSFVKGRIQIAIAPEGVCETDRQQRNVSLCRKTKSCPEDSLCSEVVHAEKRCVPNIDQLFVVLPTIERELFCKFGSCLEEMLGGSNTTCLSSWNEQRREKREAHHSIYLDTLNITVLRKQNKRLLLRAAVWELQDTEQLTLLPRQSLPPLQGSDDVIFITTKDDCDWLKGSNIECPVADPESKNAERKSSTPLESTKIQAAIGAGAAILLIVIIIVIVYCLRRRRKQNKEVKRQTSVGQFANMAFDESELKELPPIPKQSMKDKSLEKKKKEKKGKPKHNFKNPVYEEPSQIHSDNETHIYNETIPQLATYAEPGQAVLEKSNDKAKAKKTISNPFYEATDVIPVQKPQNNSAGNTYANISGLTEKATSATKEPEYETLPPIQDKKEKKGLFRLSKSKNKKPNGEQELDENIKDNINTQTPAVYACVNKVATEGENPVEKNQQSMATTKDPHYEELPLPDPSEINNWKCSQQCVEAKPENENQQSPQSHTVITDDFNQAQNIDTEISGQKESKCPPSKEHEYEELPPIKEEKKRKGIFRLSKAKHDFKNPEQETKTDRKNSTNSQTSRLSVYSETSQLNMLNPRDKAKKDNPANKYPFYEELPVPIRDSKRTESFFTQGGSQNENGSSSPVYHVLEQQNDENKGTPHYFILEKPTESENKIYKSLHRELDPPSPAYESYRLPQKSGSKSGSQANEVSNAEGVDEN